MNKQNIFVLIGIPSTGQIQNRTFMSVMAANNYIKGTALLHVQEACYVDNSRDKIVKIALREKASHVLFVDSDIEFPPEAVQQFLDHDLDIVGALYPRRQYPYRPTINKVDGKRLIVPASYPKDRLFETDAVGTGFMLIKTSVFKKLGDPPYFRIQKFYGQQIRDDVYFCITARRKGFKVWVDPTIVVGHVGNYVYTMQDHENVKPELERGDVLDIWDGEL